jgi:hypothetical protein
LSEHLVVARMYTPRQLKVFAGCTVRVGTSPTPLQYYAVRDPSIVRVIPLNIPPGPDGFRHMKLAFQFDRPQLLADAVTVARPNSAPATDLPAAFLLSIGLVIAQEEQFFRRTIVDPGHQEFPDLYTRVRELAGPVL